MSYTVVGVFDSPQAAQAAAQQLRQQGFSMEDMHITDSSLQETSVSRSTDLDADGDRDSGVIGGIRNFFSDLFSSDDERDREVGGYASAVNRGGAVIKVEVDSEDRAEAARMALQAAGADDVDADTDTDSDAMSDGVSGAESYGGTRADIGSRSTAALAGGSAIAAGAVGAAGSAMGDTARTAAQTSGEEVIPVMREEIEVGKRTVAKGGVRVFARTVERPVNESVTLREEHAHVERRPVDRPASEADLAALQDRSIEVRETAERAVVQKTARIVEEVRVGKQVSERTEEIRDTVRETKVDVQQLQGDGSGTAGGTLSAADFDTDIEHYRTDWQSRTGTQGGRWEDAEPAYRYGHGLRSDSRYSGRDWSSIEPDVRRDWEARNPGSAWERAKDSVQSAWNRMTS